MGSPRGLLFEQSLAELRQGGALRFQQFETALLVGGDGAVEDGEALAPDPHPDGVARVRILRSAVGRGILVRVETLPERQYPGIQAQRAAARNQRRCEGLGRGARVEDKEIAPRQGNRVGIVEHVESRPLQAGQVGESRKRALM